MNKNIKSISLYTNGQRIKLSPDSEGRFLVPNISKTPKSPPLVRINAAELISHPKLMMIDPVLTLENGSKVRVFQGGDPSGLITRAASLCDLHDNKHSKKSPDIEKKNKEKIIFSSSFLNNNYRDFRIDWGIDDDDW